MSGTDRDARLDFFRGLALLMIFINHMPGNVFTHATLANLGFSDAAEVFVILAGMAATFAYGSVFARDGALAGTVAVLARMRRLYVTHLVLFLFAASILAFAATRFGDPMYLEAMGFDVFVQNTPAAILRAVTLTYLPPYIDILPLYIVLIGTMPLVLLLLRLHPLAPLAVSGAVYGAARWLGLNLPNYPDTLSWYFNPLAWQLLFVIGATVAHLHRIGRWRMPLPGLVTALSAGYLAFALAWAAPWRDLPAFANLTLLPDGLLPPVDKTNLSLLRLLNVLAQVWLVSVLLRRDSALVHGLVGRPFVVMGRNSLEVFAFGTVLAIAGSVVLKETAYVLAVQVAFTGAGFVAMIAQAWAIEWWRARRMAAKPLSRAGTFLPSGPVRQ